MADFDPSGTIILASGSVEYDAKEAAVTIESLITLLEEAQSEGATHVVGSPGNHRGPKYISLIGYEGYDWLDDE